MNGAGLTAAAMTSTQVLGGAVALACLGYAAMPTGWAGPFALAALVLWGLSLVRPDGSAALGFDLCVLAWWAMRMPPSEPLAALVAVGVGMHHVATAQRAAIPPGAAAGRRDVRKLTAAAAAFLVATAGAGAAEVLLRAAVPAPLPAWLAVAGVVVVVGAGLTGALFLDVVPGQGAAPPPGSPSPTDADV